MLVLKKCSSGLLGHNFAHRTFKLNALLRYRQIQTTASTPV
ncbi:Uncharacterised protein [Vibrio cholerae]|nr:Uncharacterised protein [Vibrio cholerae]